MIKLTDDIKKLLKSLLLLSAFIFVILFTNLLVDPGNIFGNDYAMKAAEIVASERNVTNLENFDDRDFLQCYVPLRKEDVDVLVLGSSRSMQVTKELTGVPATFCAGVTGSDLRDCIGAYMLFRENSLIPDKVVFCAEYWFLSSGNLDSRALTDYYEKFCSMTDNTAFKTPSLKRKKLKELFSFTYFQSSLKYLISSENKLELEATDNPDNTYPTRRNDGSYSYEESYRNRPIKEVENDAYNSTISNTLARSFTGIDSQLVKQLEDFIVFMQNDGVEVSIQLSPVHPTYYAHMTQSPDYTEIISTEDYYYSLEEKLDINCYGSLNPNLFSMVSSDFYDAQHPTALGIYKYFMTKR